MIDDRDTEPPPAPTTDVSELASDVGLELARTSMTDITLADVFGRLECLADIHATVNAAARDMRVVSGQMQSLGTALEEIRGDIRALADRIRALENRDDHVSRRLDDLERQYKTLERRFDALERHALGEI